MRQYVEQKKKVGDAVLLFRMGDFYETFYDDAVLCSRVLGIALTSRDKNSANPVPLAGIPYHALDGYLKKLVDAGYKVAVSEQLEDPKLAKGVVKRDVVRIVTAGTLIDDHLLTQQDANILASICLRDKQTGLALVELAGGRFEVVDVDRNNLLDELVRAKPAELLIDDDRNPANEDLASKLHQICNTAITRRPLHEFSNYQAERSLLEHFEVSTLSGFGFDRVDASLCAAGGAIQYLLETQKTALSHIVSLGRRITSRQMQIDHGTWRSLEIERTMRTGALKGTLLWAIERTVHPIGGRKLRHWLRAPLVDIPAITRRQDAVDVLTQHESDRGAVRQRLKRMADVERIASRVALNRTSPRDLSALGQTLISLPSLCETIRPLRVALLNEVAADLAGLTDLADLLTRALRDDPPSSPRDGGFMADGFDEELDRLREVGRNGQTWLAEFQRKEIERTGIASLKVGYNRVFGYYIEAPRHAAEKVPPEYVRKQTIKNAERYITDELKKYETEVLGAQEQANQLECTLFEELRVQVAQQIEPLMRVSDAIGRLDVVAGFAELAIERRYARPELVEDGTLLIRDGRHPVLDQTLGDEFVPNDSVMGDDGNVFVITGPNMAGKSTYIRQVALLSLLAQTGSFVPAREMKLGVVDRLFARVGSADEIMHGQSTFMVEMTEAANILHNATERSLVVLDELGRGTSTYDGLSLAWAITEHLATEIQCRSLVATHYHEMTELADLFGCVRNFNVAVRETHAASGDGHDADQEGIVFLHKIVEGPASKSYGIHVAKLAGIPKPVIARSREVLDELQRSFEHEAHTPQLSRKKTVDHDQLALFAEPNEELRDNSSDQRNDSVSTNPKDQLNAALREEISALNPDEMTPLDALQRLAEWKKRYGSL